MDKNQRLCYKLTIAVNIIGASCNCGKKSPNKFLSILK
jgi:hypothetical protein